MAFLKSSRITGITARDVAVRGFRQSNNINLGTRAYTRHEVLLADSYSITGDVTISDNLILAKLSDDGNAITVTGNATTTRTISGSGSLEGSTFAQTPNASLTGMSGVVGSAVTGGSGLTSLGTVTTGTLGSDIIFPAGLTIQVQSVWSDTHYNDTIGVGDNTFASDFFKITITPKQSGSWFRCIVRWSGYMRAFRDGGLSVQRDGVTFNAGDSSVTANNPMIPAPMGYDQDQASAMVPINGVTINKAGSTAGTPIVFRVVANHEGSAEMRTNRPKSGSTDEVSSSEFIVEEIAQ